MGELSKNDKMDSIRAINDFRRECTDPSIFTTKVVVLKKNEVIFDDDIQVTLPYDANVLKIHIDWEDAGLEIKEFKQLGLFGTYWSSFVKMEYSPPMLIIYSDDNIIIKIMKK